MVTEISGFPPEHAPNSSAKITSANHAGPGEIVNHRLGREPPAFKRRQQRLLNIRPAIGTAGAKENIDLSGDVDWANAGVTRRDTIAHMPNKRLSIRKARMGIDLGY